VRTFIGGLIALSLIFGINRADATDSETVVLVNRQGDAVGTSVFTSMEAASIRAR
jgi:hypothetical protein